MDFQEVISGMSREVLEGKLTGVPWRRTESVGGDNIEDIELSGN
jgi:hypothetical protein